MGRSGDGKRPGVGGSREEARFARRFPVFLVAFVLVVIGLQILLRFDTVRRFPNESIRLEGVPLARVVKGLDDPICPWIDWPPGYPGDAGTGTVYLRLLAKPAAEVWVLVNDHRLGGSGED